MMLCRWCMLCCGVVALSVYREERTRRRVSDMRSFIRSINESAGADKGDPTKLLETFQKMVRRGA